MILRGELKQAESEHAMSEQASSQALDARDGLSKMAC